MTAKPNLQPWKSPCLDLPADSQWTSVLQTLLRNGFRLSHIRGSHHYLRKADTNRLVVVPVHGGRDLPAGTLKAILRQAELTPEEFQGMLR